MGKLVVIKIGSGSFEQGFPVTLQMGEDGASFHTSLDGKLPPNPEIPSLYTTWQFEYRHFLNPPRVAEPPGLGKKPATQQRTAYSVTDVNEKAEDLIKNLNRWLNSETFRPIKDKLQQKLKTDDTVRVIIQTEDSLLRRLPWYLWDLFASYRLAEVALSSPAFERVEKLVQPKTKVRILAILGDRSHPQTGIPIDIEADRQFLESLPDAETVFLVEPTRQEFNDKLWDRNGWDILFFAGHSSSQPDATSGKMYINHKESLTIPDLKLALQKAIERGLQLAIFNSCDGLGIAKNIAELHIPQIIVMREPVPDLVAKEFLKYFLISFLSGQPLYISVREARERLHGLENYCPCSTWLPIICQNLAEIPITWQGLQGINTFAKAANEANEKIQNKWYLAHPYAMPPNFTGRVAERQMLSEWLNGSHQQPLLLLRALGGFGKSALTWYWLLNDVDQNRWRQVIWWSFYETDASFDNFVQAALLHLFNYVSSSGSPRERIDNLLNSLLYNEALLILDGFERELRAFSGMNAAYQGDELGQFDNRENERDCINSLAEIFLQRFANIPHIRSRVLLTTRLRPRAIEVTGGILLQGCKEEELTGMVPDDAIAYCRAQGIQGEATEIEQACAYYGYHPLSLRLLTGLIINDLQQPGDISVAQRLNVSGDLVQRRHHVMEQSYESLTPISRQLLSTIACFRSPVAYDNLSSIFKKEEINNLDSNLRELLSRGLLHREKKTNRYDLHPIVRHYAYERLGYGTRKNAHRQLKDFFAAVPLPKRVQNLNDIAPLIELYHHTVQAGLYEEAFEMLFNRIHQIVYFEFCANQLQIDLLRVFFPYGENRLPQLNNESYQAWVLNQLAISYGAIGEPSKAITLIERQNNIQWKLNAEDNIAIGLGNLSNQYRDIGALQTAVTMQRQRITLCQKITDKFNEAVGHQDLGLLLAYCGAWIEAEEELVKALRWFEEEKSLSSCGIVLAHRALKSLLLVRVAALHPFAEKNAQQNENYVTTALVAANQAMQLANETAHKQGNFARDYVRSYWLFGAANRVNGNIEEADRYLSDALTRCRGISLVNIEANILLELAQLQLAMSKQGEALHLAQEALSISKRCGYVLQETDTHLFLGQMALDNGDIQTGLLHAREARTLATCDGIPNYTYKAAYDEAGALLGKLGRMKI